jgi:predicted transcriptional regulator
MTMTIDISPEMKEKLDAEAAKRRQTPEEYARTVVENSLPKTAQAGHSWSEIAGAAAYPMTGEDAQDWVTRTRREGDEHRERALRWEVS